MTIQARFCMMALAMNTTLLTVLKMPATSPLQTIIIPMVGNKRSLMHFQIQFGSPLKQIMAGWM